MAIIVDKVTAPAYWACYLINGDAGDMTEQEIAAADKFCKWLGRAYVVSCESEPYFTNYWPGNWGQDGVTAGEVLDYITHERFDPVTDSR